MVLSPCPTKRCKIMSMFQCFSKVRIKEQPVKRKKKGLSAKRRRRAGDEDEAEEERQREEQQADRENDEDEEEEEEAEPVEDPLASLTQQQLTEAVVELLLPGETVAAALRRLGGLGGRKKGKLRLEDEDPAEEDEAKRDTEKLDRLTALADRLVGSGMYEIYQQTQEKLAYMMKSMTDRKPALRPSRGSDDDEGELDMFADKFDDTHGGREDDDDTRGRADC